MKKSVGTHSCLSLLLGSRMALTRRQATPVGPRRYNTCSLPALSEREGDRHKEHGSITQTTSLHRSFLSFGFARFKSRRLTLEYVFFTSCHRTAARGGRPTGQRYVISPASSRREYKKVTARIIAVQRTFIFMGGLRVRQPYGHGPIRTIPLVSREFCHPRRISATRFLQIFD